MKTAVLRQPAGLGDIFYLQKAAKVLVKNEYKVIWPLAKGYVYIKDYIRTDGIEYYDETTEFPYKEMYGHNSVIKLHPKNDDEVVFIPFQDADRIMQTVPMKAKYPLVGINDTDWQDYFTFTRDTNRENRLKEYYGIKDGDEFIFINNSFGSPPEIFTREVNITDTTSKQIKVDPTKLHYDDGEPIHLFDYCWILENAKQIHTVETSFCYLIEKLNTTNDLYMYSRKINGRARFNDFSYVDHIYKRKWSTIL
jgi:hypothetical protein